jgi:hypothetical protein
MKTSQSGWLIAFLVGASGSAMGSDTTMSEQGVKIELRTIVIQTEHDVWGRNIGFAAVLTNRSDRAVKARRGYDGQHNLLLANPGFAPIQLRPRIRVDAVSKPTDISIRPGESITLFNLSARDILQLADSNDESSAWRWAWFGPPRKPPPPHSPVHLSRGLGWQAVVEPTALLYAQVTVDGKPIRSEILRYAVKPQQQPVGPITTHDRSPSFTITTTDGSVLLRQEELVAYHWPSHSLRFQPGVLMRARERAIKSGAGGVEFQVRVGREILYSGTLTTLLNSRRYAGVVLYLDCEEKTVLQWSPPAPSHHNPVYANVSDPRANPTLKSALVDAQLLLR